jgi:hypothetical protein
MLNWFSKPFKRRAGDDGAQLRAYRRLRARYDAAVTNSDNYRHWANADGLSADAAASPEVRRILRNRARYGVANSSCAQGIVLAHRSDQASAAAS